MKRLLVAVVAAALTFGGVPASVWAQDEDTTKQVEELSGKAAAAYKEGNYDKAVELFEQAYELQAVPNLLFNIAKVYEKLEDWDAAIANYRKFVTAPDADSGARETALNRIDQLEEAKRAREEEEEKRRLAEEEQKRKEEQHKQQQEQQTAQTTDDGGGSTTFAWVLTGTGVGLLGGGAVFGAIAANQQSRFRTGETTEVKRDARSKGKTYALVADSMFAAGAVAATVGIILFAVSGGGGESGASESAAIPVGWVGDQEAGVGVHVRF